MTGMTRSSAGLSSRQRKALYRAWHRGMRETDLILGSFADHEIGLLSETELAEFESLLDRTDSDILAWVTGNAPVPASVDTELFRRIKAHRPDSAG